VAARRVILVRHAPAVPRDARRYPDDADRPLRADGRKEFRRAARAIARLVDGGASIATSPLARARETAEILRRALGVRVRPALWNELEPEGPVAPLLGRVSRARRRGFSILVGHEPQFSRLVGYSLFGEAVPPLKVSKGGAIRIDFPEAVKAGGGRLIWAITRSQLRTMKGREDDEPDE
jgi:phosphohistidine phosphatase